MRVASICLAAIWVTVSHAQLVIDHEGVTNPYGCYFYYESADTIPVDVGTGGEDQQWEFWPTSVVREGMQILQLGATPYDSAFPGATRAWLFESYWWPSPMETLYVYEAIDSSNYSTLGMAGTIEGVEQQVWRYDAPEQSLPLPLQYLDAWSSVRRWTYVDSNSTVVTRVDSIQHHVDGWGEVFDLFEPEALRTFCEHRFIEISGEDTVSYTYLSYDWLDYAGLTIRCVQSLPNETNPQFTVGKEFIRVMFIDNAEHSPVLPTEMKVSLAYPNPFNGSTRFSIHVHSATSAEVGAFDILGRTVYREARALAPGRNDIDLSLEGWSSGVYFLTVRANGELNTQRIYFVK